MGAVFFGNVNQVLVRLLTCRGQPSLTGCPCAEMYAAPRPRQLRKQTFVCAE
jgi:hypothetical protein